MNNIFAIKWSSRIPPTNKRPATGAEIKEVMCHIREAASKVEPGGNISIEGRAEVIEEVAKGIEDAKQGFCLVDFSSDGPKFNPITGEYLSFLQIFPNKETQDEWLKNF